MFGDGSLLMLGFFGALSPWHILLVMVVALLLFGNRLPEVARSLGRSFNEFKRGLKDVTDELKDDPEDADKAGEKPKLRKPAESRPRDVDPDEHEKVVARTQRDDAPG